MLPRETLDNRCAIVRADNPDTRTPTGSIRRDRPKPRVPSWNLPIAQRYDFSATRLVPLLPVSRVLRTISRRLFPTSTMCISRTAVRTSSPLTPVFPPPND